MPMPAIHFGAIVPQVFAGAERGESLNVHRDDGIMHKRIIS